MPEVVTLLNVTVESCDGTTETLAPAGVLNNVAIARTISPSTSAYSESLKPALAPPGQPPPAGGFARKNRAADAIAAFAPGPPTAARPMTMNDVICASPTSHEPSRSCCATRKL